MRKLLSLARIWIGKAGKVLLNRNEASEAHESPINQNLLQITSEWDHRPREASRRFKHAQRAGMETADLPTPSVAEDTSDNVRFDDRWLEFGSHPFGRVDGVVATAPNEPIKPSLSDQERAVSAYD